MKSIDELTCRLDEAGRSDPLALAARLKSRLAQNVGKHRVRRDHPRGVSVFRVGVTLTDLSFAGERQLDMLLDDDRVRKKWESASGAIDVLNARYGRTVLSLGLWRPPAGGHVGGKISYTRIHRRGISGEQLER